MAQPSSRIFLQTIGGYDLTNMIAEGGMGTVYKGRHQTTGAVVAIKVVPPHLVANRVFLKRFELEYNVAKTLDHPNIVKALEFGCEGDTPYLVMEYVEGESVGQRLERVTRLGEIEAIQIIAEVAQGLHQAHKSGLIHRDVKPDNILLALNGKAKLVDLGLVKEIDADLNLTRTNRGLGTPYFMAPEQFRNAKKADARCDIYSMAATLYMMVTGEMPFKACSPLDAWMKKINNELSAPRELLPTLSERVDWAIRRSMSADPSQRAATCREFVEDLTGRSTGCLPTTGPAPEKLSEEKWFLVYTDEEGVVHTVKGSMKSVRRLLKEGLLGDASNVRISRTREGEYEPLRKHPEFRDLVVDLAPTPRKTPTDQSALPAKTPERITVKVATPVKLPELSLPIPSTGSVVAPHIDMGKRQHSAEWLKIAVLLVVALATGIAGYFFMPVLLHWRWL